MYRSKHFYGMEYILLFLIGFTSSFYIIQINGQPICIWLMFLMTAYMLFTNSKFIVKKNVLLFFMFYVCIFFSSFAQIYITKTNVFNVLAIYMVITLFSLVSNRFTNMGIYCFVKGIKLSFIVQLFWCFFQYVIFILAGIDVNNLIFVDTLHLVERTSRLYRGTFVVTGLCWHPSNLVFVIILLLLFYPKWYIWLLCILVTLLSKSSTLIIALLAVVLLLGISKIHESIVKKRIKLNTKKLLFFVISILLFVLIVTSTGVLFEFVNQVENILLRITGASGDTSSSVHMNYYLRYLDVVKRSNPYTFLFGYGYGYSGYPISKYYGQYTSLNTWTVESDIMNLLYGTGIIGFVTFYTWYFSSIRKALKIDIKYVIMLISLAICGITYNNQMTWVIVVEILIFECVRRGMNIFDIQKKIDKNYMIYRT